MSSGNVIFYVLQFVAAVPAIVFHEVSHGYVAYLLGDTTAKDRGRLSLNPIKHVDPFGTILLPILMIATLGVGFGYAKPVPVNPWRFKDRRKGMFLTGIAGPMTNLGLAAIGGAIVRVLALLPDSTIGWYALLLFYYFVVINLVLMFFNLIPIPPLDGSRVLPLFLSDNAMRTYAQVEKYGFLVLLALIFLGPRLLGFDPISAYFSVTVDPIARLLTGLG